MADLFDNVFNLRPRTRKRKQPEMTPEEEQGVLASLGSNALSGLGFVGNVLDTPGAMLRNTIVGENPFKGVFDPEQRTSGRDVLEQYGMLDPNQAGMDAGDVAGFGAEVLLDPLTYLTLGGSALTKTGKAVKNAGMMGDVTRIASQKAGKEVGKRVSRLTTTAADLFGGDAVAASRKLGITEAEAAEKLGGMFGIGLPFMEPSAIGGTGKIAQKVAGGMDAVGEAARFGNIPGTNYSPGMHLAQLFDYRVGPTDTKLTQKAAIRATEDFERNVGRADKVTHAAADAAHDYGLADEAGGDAMREFMELGSLPTGPAPAPVTKAVNAMHAENLRGIHDKRVAGGMSEFLQDPAGINYVRRQAVDIPGVTDIGGEYGSSGRHMSGRTDADLARVNEFKGIVGGTTQLKKIIADPDVIKAAKDKTVPSGVLEGLLTHRYGAVIMDHQLIPDMANRLRGLPIEQMEKGLFANHPIVDFAEGARNNIRAAANLRSGMEGVISKTAAPYTGILNKSQFVETDEVLKTLGYDATQFPHLAGTAMPKKEAESLTRMFDGFKSPKAVNAAIAGLDSYMNLWKAGVLTRPARYVRDLISGGVQNINEGQFSIRDYIAAHKLLKGESVESLAEIPVVKQMLQSQNLPPEKASDMVRQLAGAYGMSGNKQAQAAVVGNIHNPANTGQLEDILGSRPGHHPVSKGEFAKTLAGKTPGASWNPTKVRGFAGATETQFPLVKAGEYAGHYTDTMNRLPAFITLLRRGVDPTAAAKRVAEAQVEYGNRTFSAFERDVMKRVMPFYSFARKQAPFVAKRLAEKPGGLMAQEIRAANQANKDPQPLPDKVTASMAIPLGQQEDGTKRFLTSLGLMHEDPLTLLQIGDSALETASKTGRQLLGRVNPVAKTLAEIPMGKLAFSGQDLREADPSIGRTMSSIKDLITGEKSIDAMGSGSDDATLAEYAATLIPGVSAISNTARTAVDQRKTTGDKALNLLTGVKITDISPKTQEAVVIERVKDKLKKSGGKTIERPYVPKYRRETASEGELDRADELLGLLRKMDERRQAAQKKPKKKKPDKSVFGV